MGLLLAKETLYLPLDKLGGGYNERTNLFLNAQPLEEERDEFEEASSVFTGAGVFFGDDF